jgi:hypothetical protein
MSAHSDRSSSQTVRYIRLEAADRRRLMTSYKLVGAVLISSAPFATRAFAQAAIDEPGNYAFFYPNADVLNASRPANAMASQVLPGSDLGGLRLSVRPHRSRRALSAKPY